MPQPHYPLSREDKALLRLANDTRTTLSAQRTLFDVVDGSARCPLDGPQGGKYDAESSGSSSSEDLEGVRGGPSGTGTTEGAARREGDVLGDAAGRSDTTRTKAKTSRPEPLLTRRRLFERVERIIAAQRAEADAERRFSAKEKGKGRAGHEAAAPSTAGSPAGPGTSSPGSVPVLSPAVVLSPSDAQALRRPTREEKSAEAAGGGLRVRTAPRLAVAAVPDGDASQGSAASSPITLVSPHEIKRVGGSGAPKQDTHADRILRLLYVFAQNGLAHTYAGSTAPDLPPGIAHLAALLYTVFAQQSLGRTNPHAEADAYWDFVALMGKVGAVVLGEGKGEEGRASGDALRRLDGRVRWADDALYRGLVSAVIERRDQASADTRHNRPCARCSPRSGTMPTAGLSSCLPATCRTVRASPCWILSSPSRQGPTRMKGPPSSTSCLTSARRCSSSSSRGCSRGDRARAVEPPASRCGTAETPRVRLAA